MTSMFTGDDIVDSPSSSVAMALNIYEPATGLLRVKKGSLSGFAATAPFIRNVTFVTALSSPLVVAIFKVAGAKNTEPEIGDTIPIVGGVFVAFNNGIVRQINVNRADFFRLTT